MDDYKEKYEAALERGRMILCNLPDCSKSISDIETIFPELAESEVERLRKHIYKFIDEQFPTHGSLLDEKNKMLAYLKKQKEQGEKVKLKALLIADKLASAEMTGRLKEKKEILNNPEKYGLQKLAKRSDEDERVRQALLTMVEKAPSDLCIEVSRLQMRTYLENQKEQKPVEIHIDNPNIQKLDPNVVVETRTDGTGELDGKALLYTADKSYKIGFRDGVASVKPVEWSEEDEKILGNIINHYALIEEPTDSSGRPKEKYLTFLKSLRPQPKQEWTEEDEAQRWRLCGIIYGLKVRGELSSAEMSDFGNWIDKWINHNPQPHWKPSEEQMAMLRAVLNDPNNAGAESCQLAFRELYEQLKKLI